MRGKAEFTIDTANKQRITPAYAGKSWQTTKFIRLSRDHPRLCGEKFSFLMSPFGMLGSPPPMRGKAVPIPAIAPLPRIPPAYAGKSFVCTILMA